MTAKYRIKTLERTYQYTILYCNNDNTASVITYKTEEFDKNPKIKCKNCDCDNYMQVIGWEEETWKG